MECRDAVANMELGDILTDCRDSACQIVARIVCLFREERAGVPEIRNGYFDT